VALRSYWAGPVDRCHAVIAEAREAPLIEKALVGASSVGHSILEIADAAILDVNHVERGAALLTRAARSQ
jgi:hypothetical protein